MESSNSHTIDPGVERVVALAELQEHYGVTGPQATALLDHFEDIAAITDADHEELQQIDGIGPMTADQITPKSTRLRWAFDQADPDERIPTYVDENGYVRHHSERDRHPKRKDASNGDGDGASY